jgi:chromosomal replication initiator protein
MFSDKNPSHSHLPSAHEVWLKTQSGLYTRLGDDPGSRAWLEPLKPISLEIGDEGQPTLRVQALNDFSAGWVQRKYQKSLNEIISQLLGAEAQVEVIFDPSAQQVPPPSTQTASSRSRNDSEGPQETSEKLPVPPKAYSGRRSTLPVLSVDPKFSFDSFIIGASNQFAHASAVAVSENPNSAYNPLFIYSQPGLGKTHLLQAIANHVLKLRPETRILYISAEQFVNDMIESVQHAKMREFRTKYRESYDLILMDDIQFIAGKERTQEEFFHTFNTLKSNGKQIVVTSDRPPKEIEEFEERIRTRFEQGLVTDIGPPEIETRIAILKAKAERDDIYLPDDVATLIATHVKSNVRELEGVLIKLQAQASLTGAEVSFELAKHLLKVVDAEESSQLTVDTIVAAVGRHFQMKLSDFRSSSRQKSISLPRQVAMFLIRKYTGMGYRDIGLVFGGKDHSTTLHACQKIEAALETDAEIREAVEAIQNSL